MTIYLENTKELGRKVTRNNLKSESGDITKSKYKSKSFSIHKPKWVRKVKGKSIFFSMGIKKDQTFRKKLNNCIGLIQRKP